MARSRSGSDAAGQSEQADADAQSNSSLDEDLFAVGGSAQPADFTSIWATGMPDTVMDDTVAYSPVKQPARVSSVLSTDKQQSSSAFASTSRSAPSRSTDAVESEAQTEPEPVLERPTLRFGGDELLRSLNGNSSRRLTLNRGECSDLLSYR